MEKVTLIDEGGIYYLQIKTSFDGSVVTRVRLTKAELETLKSTIAITLS
tara:strand:- start:1045 stop:1191 length:147 start_codon:yes stop_codon:yes gene_type:complete